MPALRYLDSDLEQMFMLLLDGHVPAVVVRVIRVAKYDLTARESRVQLAIEPVPRLVSTFETCTMCEIEGSSPLWKGLEFSTF